MKYFKDHAVKEFTKRFKYNRKQRFDLTQSDIGDSSQISQIESGKRNITSTILYDFHLATGLDYTEIIFGDINRFVRQLFYTFFSTILLRNFQIIEEGYYIFPIDDFDKLIQSDCLCLAQTFADFNLQRRHFEQSDDDEMDDFDKEWDRDIFMDGVLFNPERSLRTKPINEETVIEFEKMFNVIWLILEDKLVTSFKNNVEFPLFKEDENGFPINFQQDKIDSYTQKWWQKVVSKDIISLTIEKLRSAPLFKIGFMVNDILTNMVMDDIPNSYLKSVPLIIEKNEDKTLESGPIDTSKLTSEEIYYIGKFHQDYTTFIAQNKTLEEIYQIYPKEKLNKLGITLTVSPAFRLIEERSFDEIISMVTSPDSTSKIENIDHIMLKPVTFTPENKARLEKLTNNDDDFFTLSQIYGSSLDDGWVSKKVKGLLTNNTQVTYYFQENLNQELLDMAQQLNTVQKAFIALLSDDEIKKFAI